MKITRQKLLRLIKESFYHSGLDPDHPDFKKHVTASRQHLGDDILSKIKQLEDHPDHQIRAMAPELAIGAGSYEPRLDTGYDSVTESEYEDFLMDELFPTTRDPISPSSEKKSVRRKHMRMIQGIPTQGPDAFQNKVFFRVSNYFIDNPGELSRKIKERRQVSSGAKIPFKGFKPDLF